MNILQKIGSEGLCNKIIQNINDYLSEKKFTGGITAKKCKKTNCKRMAQNKSGYCALHGKNK